MKTEPLASAQLEALSLEADQPPAVPRRTSQPPALCLPSPMRKNPEMLQSHCSQKKPTSGKEYRKRDLSPPSDEDDSSGPEEEDGSSSEDAVGYDRERRQYNEDRRRWQENAQRNPPRDGGEDDPEEPPGGGGGGAGGVVYTINQTLITGTYTVSVGNGGTGGIK